MNSKNFILGKWENLIYKGPQKEEETVILKVVSYALRSLIYYLVELIN